MPDPLVVSSNNVANIVHAILFIGLECTGYLHVIADSCLSLEIGLICLARLSAHLQVGEHQMLRHALPLLEPNGIVQHR